MGARVYREAFTTRKTKALGCVSMETTDELCDVAAVSLRRLEPPAAERVLEPVDCAPEPLLVCVICELLLLRELGGRSGGSLLSGN